MEDKYSSLPKERKQQPGANPSIREYAPLHAHTHPLLFCNYREKLLHKPHLPPPLGAEEKKTQSRHRNVHYFTGKAMQSCKREGER